MQIDRGFAALRNAALMVTCAAIGGLISVLIVSTGGQHLATYAAAVLMSMLACWLCNVSSAAANVVSPRCEFAFPRG